MVWPTTSSVQHCPVGAAALLEAGTGTGILGPILTALGYTHIVGFDASEGMLGHAVAKNIYRDLRVARLGERLDYDDDCFAASVACGVFTEGHAPLDGLDELVRVTQPGGHVVFSISRSYLGETFETKAKALAEAGRRLRAGASAIYDSAPGGDSVLKSQALAFKVC